MNCRKLPKTKGLMSISAKAIAGMKRVMPSRWTVCPSTRKGQKFAQCISSQKWTLKSATDRIW
jgi:hypothetical protein